MRLERISVKNLFGLFDHDVSFPGGGNVVIIHGPNGFGKTVILRMINSLVSGQVGIFLQTPFSEFAVHFDDGSKRVAYRRDFDSRSASPQSVIIRDVSADGREQQIRPDEALSKEVLDMLDPYVPGLKRFQEGWLDRKNEFYSLVDVLGRFPELRRRLPTDFDHITKLSEVADFAAFMVETNRTIGSSVVEQRSPWPIWDTHPRDEPTPPRVIQYSQQLTRRIEGVLADYAKHSQERDRTFPERLVHFLRAKEKVISNKEILQEMRKLEILRRRLVNLGFLDTEDSLADLTEDDVNRAREALTIYVDDVRQKLGVFNELATRVDILLRVVNELFMYKHVAVDRSKGIVATSRSGLPLSLDKLSSGEQHQLVLLYELLFLVAKKGVVLIDEPEISLHVSWQTRFLNDLISVLDVTGAQAVIATHSPALIGHRWDLTVALSGPTSVRAESSNDATRI